MNEAIANARVVKAFSSEDKESEKYKNNLLKM